ncbi:MAG TPA: hypothetical protein PKU96_00750 [bacterium]|nr:hypothetical protein [Myxococcales bacterium]OQA61949.1 MAG: Virginiamycin B lyase [bacterium ADurb.Bin270]HPW44885.1 hypothetical protein [bacterium]HQC50224.1 hypothetical protein [bacterium]HQH80192.1 hypothetical protein [bacterium]
MKKLISLVCFFSLISSVASAFETIGFQNPYGVAVDPDSGSIYVSNINGPYDSRDGNGFISKLRGDGTVDQMRYLGGESGSVTMNAPKGMAVVGGKLYAADIDKLRVFDLRKGTFLYNINFGDYLVRHLVGIIKGPDRALYVTDGPANIIYRIDPDRQHEVTLFASGDFLGEPHGICWHPVREIFMILGWASGELSHLDKIGKRQILPSVSVPRMEGCAVDSAGNVYLSSESLGTIFRLSTALSLFPFSINEGSPVGILYRESAKDLISVSMDSNKVKSFLVDNEK